jgi:hypothetical protein
VLIVIFLHIIICELGTVYIIFSVILKSESSNMSVLL